MWFLILSCSKKSVTQEIKSNTFPNSKEEIQKEDLIFEVAYQNDRYNFTTKSFTRTYSNYIKEIKINLKEETLMEILSLLNENREDIYGNKDIIVYCGDREAANSTREEIKIRYNNNEINYIFINDIDVYNTEENKDNCFNKILLYKVFSKVKEDLTTNKIVLELENSDIYIE